MTRHLSDCILVTQDDNAHPKGRKDEAGRKTGDSCKYNQGGVIFSIHRYFQDCLQSRRPIRTPPDEGVKVLRLSTLALESSREHTKIKSDERM